MRLEQVSRYLSSLFSFSFFRGLFCILGAGYDDDVSSANTLVLTWYGVLFPTNFTMLDIHVQYIFSRVSCPDLCQ